MESKIQTLVFVDYESWFWGLFNHHNRQKPDLEGFFDELKSRCKLDEIYFFGDFSKTEIQHEPSRIRKFTNNVIECKDENSEKNHTDFIMLNEIYKSHIQRKDVEQFVLVTGDGHFSSVISFLRTYQDKKVGVFGVQSTFSNRLKEFADWYVEIKPQAGVTHEFESIEEIERRRYVQMVLDSLHTAELKGIISTFSKTVPNCARFNSVGEDRIKETLSRLIRDGYIEQKHVMVSGREVRSLCTNWNVLENEKIYFRKTVI